MWPIQWTFLLFIFCRLFLSSMTFVKLFISHTISPTNLHSSPTQHFKTFQVSPIYFTKCPSFSTIQSYVYSKCSNSLVSSLNLSSFSWCKVFCSYAFWRSKSMLKLSTSSFKEKRWDLNSDYLTRWKTPDVVRNISVQALDVTDFCSINSG